MSRCTISERWSDSNLDIKFNLDDDFYTAVDDLKEIPGAHFDSDRRLWLVRKHYRERIERWVHLYFQPHEIQWQRADAEGYSDRSGSHQERARASTGSARGKQTTKAPTKLE